MQPETRYARSGDVNIAYQVVGDGPFDLVFIPGFISHVEIYWEEPMLARFFQRLASFSRLIVFDKRGQGMSDPVAGAPTLEQRMDDARAVMDAAGSERASLFGVSEGGPMSMLFSATYPERTAALVIYGSYARSVVTPDYPWGAAPEQVQAFLKAIGETWGQGLSLPILAPSLAGDQRLLERWARIERIASSPGMTRAILAMSSQIDVRHVLATIRVPTLIVHRAGDMFVPVGHARYMAEHIPDARYVELPGDDHLFIAGDTDAILDEAEEFLTGARHAAEPDRVLATVMFTDIVGSTERAAELGDRRWRELLESHYSTVRGELERFRGREVKTIGDGFLATFDGPARGIRCARRITEQVGALGIELKVGLHTGECEAMNGDLGGIAVHIGARVAAKAGPGEVLVSNTVRDLVAGSGIEFADRGAHELKGVPGEWRLFAVNSC
jgi:pimeloyl-ACP methyl ester carboxylesterase